MALKKRWVWMPVWGLLGTILLVGCSTTRGLTPDMFPTRASVEAQATAIVLTQNAPPPPFNDPQVGFRQIDAQLSRLPGWRYVVGLEFDGVFARTPRTTRASARAEVWFNQLASARRVSLVTEGELIGGDSDNAYEAVRLGPDSFLVRDSGCVAGGGSAETAAGLTAGDLLGGVARAIPAGRQAVINGAPVYAYNFAPDDLILPLIRPLDDGSVTVSSSDLWIAPDYNAVVRFYVNLEVENVILLDRQLPVSGQVLLRYDLFDVGTAYNISVPFGC